MTMNENNTEFDPRDLDHDGKVSMKEKLLDAADKANEAIYGAADAIKDGARKVIGKVKEYDALSPEEKKARQEEWKEKASDVAGKAADSAKEFAEEVKEGAEKLFGNKKEEE